MLNYCPRSKMKLSKLRDCDQELTLAILSLRSIIQEPLRLPMLGGLNPTQGLNRKGKKLSRIDVQYTKDD